MYPRRCIKTQPPSWGSIVEYFPNTPKCSSSSNKRISSSTVACSKEEWADSGLFLISLAILRRQYNCLEPMRLDPLAEVARLLHWAAWINWYLVFIPYPRSEKCTVSGVVVTAKWLHARDGSAFQVRSPYRLAIYRQNVTARLSLWICHGRVEGLCFGCDMCTLGFPLVSPSDHFWT